MPSNTQNINDLREHVNKLKILLDDPHPGLASWQEFYRQRMQVITDFWLGEGVDIALLNIARKSLSFLYDDNEWDGMNPDSEGNHLIKEIEAVLAKIEKK